MNLFSPSNNQNEHRKTKSEDKTNFVNRPSLVNKTDIFVCGENKFSEIDSKS